MIKCEKLSLGYDGKAIVDNLNFEIQNGDYLCVLGENGVGKSTLIKTLLKLIKPISGEVIYNENLLPTEIGYLSQQQQLLKDFPASVFEIVLSGCQSKVGIRPFYKREEKQTAKEKIEKLGLLDLMTRSFSELSGGQQQRVLLARALMAGQRLMILDEPVTGLDPEASRKMYEIINELNKSNMTIVMISHDIEVALDYATKVLYIGQNIFYGTTLEYKKSRGIA
ncbi:ABC transporter ATP-binding protein [Lachnoanaerobaculum sp. Marseille-Q4761]|jgi:hypothetical protein|uniref:metal ABC transporter ATP-binding protein n=1 Tax=Lachnoanaerobaculum sp. Marseille-Q4761 TaxID=2819511 RepID=UPI001AA166F5|nr:ABC transporter ATP-binding protein [Lachnoanaerobaculum sp. Marseille-Q4761]MBO1870687.1 ABC transporter ATP-binding protein [Lachnoanaerobaculum sp. Marseille-Q4761]